MARPRILVSYFFGPDAIPLGDSCVRALRHLGWDAEGFHAQVESPLNLHLLKWVSRLLRRLGMKDADVALWLGHDNDSMRDKALLAHVERFRPEIVLVIRGNSVSPGVLRRLKHDFGVRKIIGWWVKDPRDDCSQLLNDIQLYDEYFCIHRFGWQESETARHMVALGVDTDLYHPLPGTRQRHVATFVGGYNERRREAMHALRGLPVEIYGPGWRKPRNGWEPAIWRRVKADGIWGEALNRVYNESKVVLNITGWNAANKTGLNMRVFDVPATGAFLLTDYSDELAEYFEPGKEVETWRTPEELADKLRYYLAHDAAREAIARAGHERVLKLESFEAKMRRMLATIGEEAA
ncbi:glycosyltransferase [Chitinivorax sp. PXF-14]|uniref:CgeB family protein n=1 Tax=Chitinivorax sp. PXF-14 TaxID=3230488 RepID=UPI003466954E